MSSITTNGDEAMYCCFLLDGEYYCVLVSEVQEVISRQRVCPVPLASESVEGLINLRGEIVTAINLRRRMGIEDATEAIREKAMNVVLRGAFGPTSLLVDSIADVAHAAPHEIDEPPETLPPAIKELVRGVIRRDERLLLVLATERVANVEQTA